MCDLCGYRPGRCRPPAGPLAGRRPRQQRRRPDPQPGRREPERHTPPAHRLRE